ncbi:roadblock/LC7 domain-containing protein [Sphaerimonospora sp. CA-214678]|uniref:roadblock/LC7 domain-containing protein n=1 Tax=Sphaerimonospora sp. CA-214678 TaxID=3240029 RepID=UPI003D933697
MTTMRHDLSWTLGDVLAVPETLHAILFTADGLLQAKSADVGTDDAEKHAAALAGLQSLSRSTAEFCLSETPGWRQTLVEFTDGYVFVVAAGPGAYLALSATHDADLEVVAHRMHELVGRLGRELSSPPRQGVGGS